MTEHEESNDKPAVSVRVMEIIVAGLMLLSGIVVATDSYRLGARWAEDGPQSGYFPFYIGIIICVCSIFILGQALRLGASHSFVDWRPLRRVFTVLFPAAGYVLLVHLFGIYVSSAFYITLFMMMLGGYSGLKSAGVGCGVSVMVFLMFEVWFKVPLHKGTLLDPLVFLGY